MHVACLGMPFGYIYFIIFALISARQLKHARSRTVGS